MCVAWNLASEFLFRHTSHLCSSSFFLARLLAHLLLSDGMVAQRSFLRFLLLMPVATMAVLYLFILRGGCDAGWHHRDCHFPRLGFHVWCLFDLLFRRVLLEVFMEFLMLIVVWQGAAMLRRLRQRGIPACGVVFPGCWVASSLRSSSSRP